jgi:hypothetical protein
MTTRLRSDEQFERAYLTHASVYVKDRCKQEQDLIGSLEAFNPLFITVSGTKFVRNQFDFIVIIERDPCGARR